MENSLSQAWTVEIPEEPPIAHRDPTKSAHGTAMSVVSSPVTRLVPYLARC